MASRIKADSRVTMFDEDGIGPPDVVVYQYNVEDDTSLFVKYQTTKAIHYGIEDLPTDDATYGDVKQKIKDVFAWLKAEAETKEGI